MSQKEAMLKLSALAGTAAMMIAAAGLRLLDAPEEAGKAISVPIAAAAALWALKAAAAACALARGHGPAQPPGPGLEVLTTAPLAAIAGLYAAAMWFNEGLPTVLLAYIAATTIMITAPAALWYIHKLLNDHTLFPPEAPAPEGAAKASDNR